VKPRALAIANNGTSLAIANYNLERKGFGPGAFFEKSVLHEGRYPIDLVSTSGLEHVQLCYAADGDRLIMAGKFTEVHRGTVVVIFWDVKSCTTLKHFECGGNGSLIDGPIFLILGYNSGPNTGNLWCGSEIKR
jgi:hypothetical protein